MAAAVVAVAAATVNFSHVNHRRNTGLLEPLSFGRCVSLCVHVWLFREKGRRSR